MATQRRAGQWEGKERSTAKTSSSSFEPGIAFSTTHLETKRTRTVCHGLDNKLEGSQCKPTVRVDRGTYDARVLCSKDPLDAKRLRICEREHALLAAGCGGCCRGKEGPEPELRNGSR